MENEPKKDDYRDFICVNCGGHRLSKGEFNVNCLAERLDGKKVESDWKTISLQCVDCGAKLVDSYGKEHFKETPEIMKKLGDLRRLS